MTFRTPNGETCPIAPGQLCELIFADGSVYHGQYAHTVLTGKPGFVQGSTGYMGRKFRSSWDWRGIGDCIPVLRYRVFGEDAFEALRQVAKNPGPAGYPCDLLPVQLPRRLRLPGAFHPIRRMSRESAVPTVSDTQSGATDSSHGETPTGPTAVASACQVPAPLEWCPQGLARKGG